MKVAMRNVEGSESDQDYLRMKFVAMRIWNGCSAVFFTLNPHDIWSPLLIKFYNGEVFGQQQLRLDWSDEEMQRFYTEAKVKFDDLLSIGSLLKIRQQLLRQYIALLCLPLSISSTAVALLPERPSESAFRMAFRASASLA